MLIPLNSMVARHRLHIEGILHVGAHLGEEAAAYESEGITNVTWVEGNPEKIPALREAVSSYGHHVIQACVSNVVEIVQFKVTNNGESSSILEFGTHLETSPQAWVTHELTLQTVRLDSLKFKHPFNFLNLDLQGYEYPALRGLGDYLDDVDYVYTEVNRREVYIGCTQIEDLDTFLHGFTRVETKWCEDAGINHGWGDALYVRG